MFAEAGTARTLGKLRQVLGCSEGPDDPLCCPIAQRWLPLRRQHAGRFASGSEANATGPISEKLEIDSNSVASIRCTCHQCISQHFSVMGPRPIWSIIGSQEQVRSPDDPKTIAYLSRTTKYINRLLLTRGETGIQYIWK